MRAAYGVVYRHLHQGTAIPSIPPPRPLWVQLPALLVGLDVDGVIQHVQLDGLAPLLGVLELGVCVGDGPLAGAQEAQERGVVVRGRRARLVQALVLQVCLEALEGALLFLGQVAQVAMRVAVLERCLGRRCPRGVGLDLGGRPGGCTGRHLKGNGREGAVPVCLLLDTLRAEFRVWGCRADQIRSKAERQGEGESEERNSDNNSNDGTATSSSQDERWVIIIISKLGRRIRPGNHRQAGMLAHHA